MTDELESVTEQIKYWQRNPWEYVQFMWGHCMKYSSQQEAYWHELGKLIDAKLKLAYGEEMTDEEIEYSKKMGISVMSGHGTGKDTISAQTNLFFLNCFANPKIPCTAPSAHQLKDILWAEISKWMRLARKATDESVKTLLEEILEWQVEKVYFKEKKGREWFSVARTVNVKASEEEQAETLSGFHEDFLVYMIDEAAGVPDPVYRPIEGALTGILNFVVMIFNPTRSKCYAVESHRGESKRWVTLRWNSEESEIVEAGYCTRMAEKYGKDSNPYRIRVLGLPPLVDEQTLIPWDWIEDAVDREIKPLDDDGLALGVDVGAGGDKSVIIRRQGGLISGIKRHSTPNTMELLGHVVLTIQEADADVVAVDGIGIGKGICDRARELGITRIYNTDIRKRARDEKRFFQTRDELAWKVREMFEAGTISIPNDSDLKDQLGAIKWEPNSRGQIKMAAKKDIKKIIGHSPDEFDALCLTFYLPDEMFRKPGKHDRGEDDDERETIKEDGWMAA